MPPFTYDEVPMAELTPPVEKDASGKLRAKATSSRIPWHVRAVSILPALAVTLVSLGLVVGILVYCIANRYVLGISGGYLHLIEGTDSNGFAKLQLLTISSLASIIMQTVGPLLLPLFAYQVAADWVHSSRNEAGTGSSNPTPTQLGILTGLLGTMNASSLFHALRYSLIGSHSRSRLTRQFKNALKLSFLVFLLGHVLGLADLWLHAAAGSLPAQRATTSTSELIPALGVQFNDTFCPDLLARDYASCFVNDFGTFGNLGPVTSTAARAQTALALSNSSAASFLPITMHDWYDTGVLVPTFAPRNYAFDITTVAANFQCESLNRLCNTFTNGTVDCSNVGYPFNSLVLNPPPSQGFSVLSNGSMIGTPSWEFLPLALNADPLKVAILLSWLLVPFPDNTDPNVQLAISPYNDGYGSLLYASCQVRFYNATVRYDPVAATWQLVDAQPSSAFFSSVLYSALLSAGLVQDPVGQQLTGVVLMEDYRNATAALNQALGRSLLAVTSGFFVPTPATNVSKVENIVLGKYPVAPLIVVLVLLVVYAALALWLLATAQLGSTGDVRHAQRWLTSSGPLVAVVFQHPALDSVELPSTSHEEPNAPRLGILPLDDGRIFRFTLGEST